MSALFWEAIGFGGLGLAALIGVLWFNRPLRRRKYRDARYRDEHARVRFIG